MQKSIYIFNLFVLLILSSCNGIFNNSQSSSTGIEDQVGGYIRCIKAFYVDNNGELKSERSQEITYGENWDEIDKIKVFAYGPQNKSAEIPLKRDDEDGYTISTYSISDDIEVDGTLEKYNAGNYNFYILYKEFSATLSLSVERAELVDISMTLPSLTWLEPIGEFKVMNLPENENFEVAYEYRNSYDEEYKTWDYDKETINTIFTPQTPVYFRATIDSRNYYRKVLTDGVSVEKYSLQDKLTLSTDLLTFEYLPTKNGEARLLAEYNFLIEGQQLSASFKNEAIAGFFAFSDNNIQIDSIGRRSLSIDFTIDTNPYYVSETITLPIEVDFIPFKIHKPKTKLFYYHYFIDYAYSPDYEFEYLKDEMDRNIYDAYYSNTDLVIVAGDSYVNPGTYDCSISLYDTSNTTWEDGSTASYSDTWKILKDTFDFDRLCCSSPEFINDMTNIYKKGEIVTCYIQEGLNEATLSFYYGDLDHLTGEYNYKPTSSINVMYGIYIADYASDYVYYNVVDSKIIFEANAPKDDKGYVTVDLYYRFIDERTNVYPQEINFRISAKY